MILSIPLSYKPFSLEGLPPTNQFVVIQLNEQSAEEGLLESTRGAVPYYQGGCPEVEKESTHGWGMCPGQCAESWAIDWDIDEKGPLPISEYKPQS